MCEIDLVSLCVCACWCVNVSVLCVCEFVYVCVRLCMQEEDVWFLWAWVHSTVQCGCGCTAQCACGCTAQWVTKEALHESRHCDELMRIFAGADFQGVWVNASNMLSSASKVEGKAGLNKEC